MARISTYSIDSIPTVEDMVIGTDINNLDSTKNYLIGDIISLVPGGSGVGISSINTATGPAINLLGKGGIIITQVSNTIFLDTTNVGNDGVLDINTVTGSINLLPKGGIVITEVGNTIFLDTTNVGNDGVLDINTVTGSVNLLPKGGIVITEVGNNIFIDGTNVGNFDSLTTTGTSGVASLTGGVLNIPNYASASGVLDINTVTGSINLLPKGGIVITEVGNTIFIDGTNAGSASNFDSLTTTGNSGLASLTSGVLNVPAYQRAITVTTGGSGSASLVGAQLNIPYESISLTTIGNSGVASLIGNVLNVPAYQRTIGVTTSGSGPASLVGAQLNIPYEPISLTTTGKIAAATLTGGVLNIPFQNPNNTGAPKTINASAGDSSTLLDSTDWIVYDVNWTGGNGTYILTLPSATVDAYKMIRIITDGTFINNTMQIQVTAPGTQTINGVSSIIVNTTYSGILVWSDGTNWRVIQAIS